MNGDEGALRVAVRDEAGTEQLAGLLAGTLTPGDVVLLVGGLGAGKTTFTKALVAALGGDEPVTSPTFTLLRTYATEPVVAHVDCWRLDQLLEVMELGLEEVLEDGGVAVIEWGEAARPLFGDAALEVVLAPADDRTGRVTGAETARLFTLGSASPRWRSRLAAIERGARVAGLLRDEPARR